MTLTVWVGLKIAEEAFRSVINVLTASDLSPFVMYSVYNESNPDVCTVVTRWTLTENGIINSPAQGTTALQPNAYLTLKSPN